MASVPVLLVVSAAAGQTPMAARPWVALVSVVLLVPLAVQAVTPAAARLAAVRVQQAGTPQLLVSGLAWVVRARTLTPMVAMALRPDHSVSGLAWVAPRLTRMPMEETLATLEGWVLA